MSSAMQDLVTRFWEEVYTAGSIETVDGLVAEDFVLQDLSAMNSFDAYKLKILVQDIHDMIQEFTVAIDDQFAASGNRVVSRLTFSARRPDDGPGYPPEDDGPGYPSEGEILTYSGMAISQVAEDRIGQVVLLWESLRAEEELEPAEQWRWPPWK